MNKEEAQELIELIRKHALWQPCIDVQGNEDGAATKFIEIEKIINRFVNSQPLTLTLCEDKHIKNIQIKNNKDYKDVFDLVLLDEDMEIVEHIWIYEEELKQLIANCQQVLEALGVNI